MDKIFYKDFSKYSDAYLLYSDIMAGRDGDRKNASIFMFMVHSTYIKYRVQWESKNN